MRQDWTDRLKANLKPYELLRILLTFDAARSPILRERDIAKDNAGEGLNLVTVMHAWTPGGRVGRKRWAANLY